MKCPNCGGKMNEGFSRCVNCGNIVAYESKAHMSGIFQGIAWFVAILAGVLILATFVNKFLLVGP